MLPTPIRQAVIGSPRVAILPKHERIEVLLGDDAMGASDTTFRVTPRARSTFQNQKSGEARWSMRRSSLGQGDSLRPRLEERHELGDPTPVAPTRIGINVIPRDRRSGMLRSAEP
jgi:hypothetical protein